METWGELFWDAWIRLRLWCRSLYRTYWPRQIKAWQICTATGIVSVILTLVALKYQTPPAKTLAEDQTEGAATKLASPKLAQAKGKLAAEKDPFADEDLAANAPPAQPLTDDQTLAGVDEMSPDELEVTEHPDPGFEPIGARKFRKNQPTGEELAAADTEPQLSSDLTPPAATEEPALPATTEPATPAAMQENELTLPPDEPDAPPQAEKTLEIPAEELFEDTPPSAAPRMNAEGTEPAEPVEPVVESTAVPVAEPAEEPFVEPAVEPTVKPVTEAPAAAQTPVVPKRDPKHYSRLGHHEDNEEDRHSVRDIRVAPPQDLPAPVIHEPLVTQIRPKSHYSRFGAHEDTEEDRHSVRDIRPTRIDVVLIPGQDAAQPATKETAPESEMPAEEAESELDMPPAVPAVENPADNLTLPPVEAVPTEAVPMPAAPREQSEFDPPIAEPDAAEPVTEGPPPPVLFAPEAPADANEPTIAEKPASRPREYHGPVLSTEGVDHEAHQDEDVFSKPKRKTPLLSEPPPARPNPPVEQPDVDQRPPVEPTTEPATEPRTTRSAPPREIHDYDDAPAATDVVVPDSRVVPMAVPDATRQRGPERITIPDRMPPVPPMEPTVPRGRQESSFAVPPTTQSVRPDTTARLVMTITGPKQAPVGTQVIWHFRIQNVGAAPATGILVSDVLPPGLQHRLSPDLEYAIERLEPGESRETNLTVQCVAPGTITNRAVLRADGDLTTEAEIQIEVTSSSPGQFVPAGKSPLTVAHHGPARWVVDSTGQFLVTVTNTSGERLKNVTICQSYPKGTNLVHATLGNKVDAANRTVTWTIPDFAPGASYILETELHSISGGAGTSSVKVTVGEKLVAEDRWTAVSFIADGRP